MDPADEGGFVRRYDDASGRGLVWGIEGSSLPGEGSMEPCHRSNCVVETWSIDMYHRQMSVLGLV